ncbi:MAG: dolichol-phosphate mannosyltransferase [Actinomycetota bacterium]
MAVEAQQSPADRNVAGPRILVVLPTYNEADNIVSILDRIRVSVPGADMLVVDDASPDGTADRVRWVAQRLPGVFLLERAAKDGLGAAYRAGFGWGIDHHYDVLIQMDADGSHRPDDVPQLIAAVAAGAELAIGSRYVAGGEIPNWKLSRRMLSRGGNQYASMMLGMGINDATSGFRAYRTGLLQRMDFAHLGASGYGFQIEGAWKAVRTGARVVEVPIRFEDRENGESKMSKAIVVEALRLVTKWGVSQRAARARARLSHPLHGSNWAHAGLAGSKRTY